MDSMQQLSLLAGWQAHLPFWPYLTERERSAVESRAAMLEIPAGQLVRGQDMDCLGFLRVLDGVLRASLLSADGREVTLYRLQAGEACVLSAACVLDAVSFDTQIVVEENCKALLIPADVFAGLRQSNVYVERDAYKMAAERFSDVVAGVERLVFLNLEQRLASFLLDESARQGSDQVGMTHEQLAVNIGSAREAVSRTLKRLSEKGWVELYRGGVRLQDKKALYRLMD